MREPARTNRICTSFLGSLLLLGFPRTVWARWSREILRFQVQPSAEQGGGGGPRYLPCPSFHAHMELTRVCIQLQSTAHLAESLHYDTAPVYLQPPPLFSSDAGTRALPRSPEGRGECTQAPCPKPKPKLVHTPNTQQDQ